MTTRKTKTTTRTSRTKTDPLGRKAGHLDARLDQLGSVIVAFSGGVDSAYLYTRGGDGPTTAFRARMYAPTAGIPEDPATGSATAILARARAEAGRTLAAADEERSRVRNLLTGALASLDPVASIEAAGPAGTSSTDLVGDLSSRLQETDTE